MNGVLQLPSVRGQPNKRNKLAAPAF